MEEAHRGDVSGSSISQEVRLNVVRMKAVCSACEESAVVDAEPSKVSNVHIEHERWCPFFAALQLGESHAAAWIKANGYPIRFTHDSVER